MAETHYKPPGLEAWDIVIVVLYFIVILAVGLYVSTANCFSIKLRMEVKFRAAQLGRSCLPRSTTLIFSELLSGTNVVLL